jgi:hypothetical protein
MNINTIDIEQEHRPTLASGAWLVTLIGTAAVMLALLFPAARNRVATALVSAPSALSLSYLSLSLKQRPHDAELRLEVARKTFEAGLPDEARALAQPLLALQTDYARKAQLLIVDIDFGALAATDPSLRQSRSEATARFAASAGALDLASLSDADTEVLADRMAQAGLAEQRAELLDLLARRPLSGREAEDQVFRMRFERADAAHLESGAPLAAAELAAFIAEREGSLSHARIALERARSADRPAELRALLARLSPLFPEDAALRQLGLELATDDSEALQLASALLRDAPEDAALRRRVAQLAEWTGDSLRAMDEYARLARRHGAAGDRSRALNLARANWDLPLVLALSPKSTPGSHATADRQRELAALLDRVALQEALGQPESALLELDSALQGKLGEEPRVLQLKAGLERRLGKTAAAEATLREIARRSSASEEIARERASLLLARGDTHDALLALQSAPAPASTGHMRQTLALALELGDLESAQNAATEIAARTDARPSDVERLYWLLRSSGDQPGALALAIHGYERFRSEPLLDLAIDSAQTLGNDATVLQLLARAEQAGTHFTARPQYWQLRASLLQARAAEALAAGKLNVARGELLLAGQSLRKAEVFAPAASDGDQTTYRALWSAQSTQVFSLALASDDKDSLARLYPEHEARLTPRERVHVLHRIGRDEDAVATAIAAAGSDELHEDDRQALQGDAGYLARNMVRRGYARGETMTMSGMPYWQGAVGADYALSETESLGAMVQGTGHAAGSPLGDSQAMVLEGRRELLAQVKGRLDRTTLAAGAFTVPNGGRPFASVEHVLVGQREQRKALRLRVEARVNELARETPALRALAVRDELALDALQPIGDDYYLQGRASAQLWSSHDRALLGEGAALDASVGRNFALPSNIGSANLRLATLLAPRGAQDTSVANQLEPLSQRVDASSLVPQSTAWMGIGGSLARGQIGAPPITGHSVAFLLDGSVGVLVPDGSLGLFGRAGVGVSVVGGDQLSLLIHAGNVMGAAPGDAVWGGSLEYSIGLWR